jgi:hypothetical protein
LPSASVDCVITSPPYYLLRDYGVDGQIGLEDSVNGWVDELRVVMGGLARVLKPTGSVWLNLADSYSRHPRYGAPAKSLLLGPERLALGLMADGWIVRNRVAWSKPNPMPSSVKDRLNATWEVIYLLTREPRYQFDLDVIRVPHRSKRGRVSRTSSRTLPVPTGPPVWAGPLAGSNSGLLKLKAAGLAGHPLGANPGDAWSIATAGFRGAHFATFPPALVTKPLLASCPERVCRSCGLAWKRHGSPSERRKLRPVCSCKAGWRPGLALDPFFGAGTVGVVAKLHHRDWLGIELNPKFARLAEERIAKSPSGPAAGTEKHVAA